MAKQANIQDEALFNDKINAAANDLAARRQVTRVIHAGTENEAVLTEWQDDLVTRAAAIDRLEGLASERPGVTPRVARQLSIYVRELSREYPAETVPSHEDMIALKNWAGKLEPIRPDMESAVQTLGRLQRISDHGLQKGDIDLRRANLQGFDLNGLNFNYANFAEAQMQGANLFRAQMQGANLHGVHMQGADLSVAHMQGANLSVVQMQGAHLSVAHMQGANLSRAQMQGANLIGAHMQGADLYRVQMQGANLRFAQMQGADLSCVQIDEGTDLNAAIFQGAALRSLDDTTIAQMHPFWSAVFADGSVQLPAGTVRPAHWVDEELGYPEFKEQWKAWQATLPNN